jgi:hypothetical protein
LLEVSREDAKARKKGFGEGEVMGKIVSLWPWQMRGLGGSNFFGVSREDAKARKGVWEGEIMGKIVLFLALAGARAGWF